jgi:hypothetical protein
MDAPTTHTDTTPGTTVPRAIGIHGRTAVLWAMAGGVALGGVLIAAMTLAGRLSGHALFLNATALFMVGAVLGAAHGTVLGFFGREDGTTPRKAARDLGLAALYAIPGLSVAWLVAVWVSMTIIAGYTGNIGALIGVFVGWLAAAVILSSAAIHGTRALANAYARWPERRAGTLLTGATFAALLVTFLADRPELWGMRLRLTETGAVLLAAALAIWVAGPLVTVGLRMVRGASVPRMGRDLIDGRLTATDLVVGLGAGLVIGLIAVPFATASVAPAAAGTLVVEVAQALLDEVLLRLFLVTTVAWVLLRWHKMHAEEAALGAIAVTALVQIGLYTPGALAIGFPTWAGTAAFITMAVALPAAAFGALYWRRGFSTALIADATALIAIALLV